MYDSAIVTGPFFLVACADKANSGYVVERNKMIVDCTKFIPAAERAWRKSPCPRAGLFSCRQFFQTSRNKLLADTSPGHISVPAGDSPDRSSAAGRDLPLARSTCRTLRSACGPAPSGPGAWSHRHGYKSRQELPPEAGWTGACRYTARGSPRSITAPLNRLESRWPPGQS